VDLGGRHKIKKALHHGTLLLDVDVLALWNYLNPDKAKLKSKGIESVVSRVMNLIQVVPDITHEMISAEFVKAFKNHFKGREVIEETIGDPVEGNPKATEIYEMFKSDDWLYGKSPEFNHHLEHRFTWGNIDLYIEVENGIFLVSDKNLRCDCQWNGLFGLSRA
jgi:lipoate-protein ligase A